MKRELIFGKVDGYNNGRRDCLVTIDFGFTEFEGQKPYFSACGNLWNRFHTDIIWGGQIIRDLGGFESVGTSKLYVEVLNLWEKYHLKNIDEIPVEDFTRIMNIIENGAPIEEE